MSSGTDIKDPDLWWKDDVPEGERWKHILTYLRVLEMAQKAYWGGYLKNARFYDASEYAGMGGVNIIDTLPYHLRSAENHIRPIVDTTTAIICRNRPRVVITTDRAKWSVQQRARKLERVIEGQFQRLDVYALAPRIHRDGCVLGLGAVKHETRNNEIRLHRTLVEELVWDREASRTTSPRSLFQRRPVDREQLKAQHPKFATEIDKAHGQDTRFAYHRFPKHQLMLTEAWHLESEPGAGDGRWTLAIDGADLFDLPFPKQKYPFVWYRWAENMTGFMGRSICEELATSQIRVNKINYLIEHYQDLIAVPRVFVHQADAHLEVKLDNDVRIWPYAVEPPQFVTPPAVPPEMFQEKGRIIQQMYAQIGVSEMAAKAIKEPGIEAAAAIRELLDNQSGRFAIQEQYYEHMFLELGRVVVERMKELGSGTKTVWAAGKWVEEIDWADVDLDKDIYSMALQAGSITSRTPSGKQQAVVEYLQAGMITPQEGRKLTGHPDLEENMSLEDAAQENAERTLERLLEGKYTPPDPLQDLATAIRTVHSGYLRAMNEDAPEDVLADLRTWLQQAQAEADKATAPAPGGAPGAPNSVTPAPGEAPPSAPPTPPPGMPVPMPNAA